MNATRPPIVSACWLVAIAPSSTMSPMTTFGMRSSVAQNAPRSRALPSWVW